MTTKEVNPVRTITLDIENQLFKLSAWNTTLAYVLEGLDLDAHAADRGNNIDGAIHLAVRYPVYSEMLFLILSGLQECEATLSAYTDRLTSVGSNNGR